MFVAACMTAAATSCSDFDDYNEVRTDGVNPSADKTLWENIESNPQLTKFAQLVKKTGFDKDLQSSHYYTVWAPVDDAIDMSQYESMDSMRLLNEFVENHIAEYNHAASGSIDERIRALNNKAFNFKGDGQSYTFDEIALNEPNIASINGVLHTLGGVAVFYPNIYSYILETGTDIDSLRSYFERYESTYLDTENSVIGPIVSGKQTYIDSVLVTSNSLLSLLRSDLEHEDSSYTVLIPSDEAWINYYNKVKPCYNYLATMVAQNLSTTNIETSTLKLDNAYMSDSLTKRHIVNNLVFSNNDAYNVKLNDDSPAFVATDSLRSTTSNKLSNPEAILALATERVEMSNGQGFKIDSMAMYPWETYSPTINVNARRSYGRILNGNSHNQTFESSVDLADGTTLTNTIDYLWAEPTSNYAKPELDIYLPNVRSTTYNFYCIFAPGYDPNTDTVSTMPNKVNFTLNYCNAKGALTDYKFSADGAENPKTQVAFINDPVKRDSNGVLISDTVFIGKFTFPVSYAGLTQSSMDYYAPNIKITTPFSQFSADMKVYTRDLRIVGLILKPVEQDEFESTKQ